MVSEKTKLRDGMELIDDNFLGQAVNKWWHGGSGPSTMCVRVRDNGRVGGMKVSHAAEQPWCHRW